MTNKILWQPQKKHIDKSQMTKFRKYINSKFGYKFLNYSDLYNWSVKYPKEFWHTFLKFSKIKYNGSSHQVCDDFNKMPGAKWFPNVKLNFAENLLNFQGDKVAIRFFGENIVNRELTYTELFNEVKFFSLALRKLGVKKGDRVVGFIPNIPEAVIAMLSSSAIGAVWSSCSPDFGVKGVLDRFSQINPSVIVTSDGYYFKGKSFSNSSKLSQIIDALPSIKKTIIVKYIQDSSITEIQNSIYWDDFSLSSDTELKFESLRFSHPLYIMYSSGTTGMPKSIVHSAGGTLLQHLKELILHTNLTSKDSIFYYTTCGWMMWNWLISSLYVGSTVVLFDGNPFYPNPQFLLNIADDINISIFGTSAKYISSLESYGVIPSDISSFNSLKVILSTGSPLSNESYDYVYNYWKKDVQLSSISGGTDIISCFALGNPTLPVRRGELQCRGLGMSVESYSNNGKPVLHEQGELVCTKAFPSMPIYFWNDHGGQKFINTYFNIFKNIWTHGDYIQINDNGGVQIYGRSDATLNPGGVRIGTAEIYDVVEGIDKVIDSVVVGYSNKSDEVIVLFVKLDKNTILDSNLKDKIIISIRKNCSPRHIPQRIVQVPDIPYTLNGKKVEVAVKKLINGNTITNQDSIANPDSLNFYRDYRFV